MSQLSWLILGGCGYVGANLVTHLITNKLAAEITVADIKPPGRCFLPDSLMKLFNDKAVNFIHADLNQDAHVERVFPAEKNYDIIIDCIAETRTGMNDDTIFNKIVGPCSKVVAKVAAISKDNKNPPFFIELSTSQVYDPTGKPLNEEGKCKPWTVVARAKYQIEQQILQEKSINYVILRPSFIYGGFNEFRSISPRLCCAAVYQKNNEKMEFLWTKSLAINTVHINDVCKAIVWSYTNRSYCTRGILNLSDSGNTTQGSFNMIIEGLFGIKTDFAGTIMSNLAKLKLKDITEEANDAHQPQWLSLARENGIEHTPYTPYISMELLYNNPLCIDGTSITKLVKNTDKNATPFTYDFPVMTQQLVYQSLMGEIERGLFPRIQINEPK